MSDTTQDLEQWDPNEDDTIIVPLEDDYALVVGPNTKGLKKIDASLVGDRALNDLIASIGEGASLTGGATSAANTIQHMSGLYKLDAVTKAQLAAGNALTKATDGQLIGTVRNAGGQITRQARLIPVSAPQIAGAIAAIGPAVAMVAVRPSMRSIKLAPTMGTCQKPTGRSSPDLCLEFNLTVTSTRSRLRTTRKPSRKLMPTHTRKGTTSRRTGLAL